MMSPHEISILLTSALGPLDAGWQVATGGTRDEEWFTVIRMDGALKKGHVTRIHNLIEELLSEELGEGDRV